MKNLLSLLLILTGMLMLSAPTYTQPQVEQMLAEDGMRAEREGYNRGYRQGMLYAYDNVVICNASAETAGRETAQAIRLSSEHLPVRSEGFCFE